MTRPNVLKGGPGRPVCRLSLPSSTAAFSLGFLLLSEFFSFLTADRTDMFCPAVTGDTPECTSLNVGHVSMRDYIALGIWPTLLILRRQSGQLQNCEELQLRSKKSKFVTANE
uniref:Secreted protein n=1 Tax=Panagrellus redivivus TaxID=6233 RepID=A0A7E4UYB8_PANRE